MKKITCHLLICISLLVTFSSCRKEDDKESAVTREIQVMLQKNQPYTLSLSGSENTYQISLQANHFFQSDLSMNGTSNEQSYQYIPFKDYIGTDEVVITGMDEEHHGKHHHNGIGVGGCTHHDDDDAQTIIIHFIIQDTGTNTVINYQIR